MSELIKNQGGFRGRWLLVIQFLAVGLVIYFVSSPQPLVTVQHPLPSSPPLQGGDNAENGFSSKMQNSDASLSVVAESGSNGSKIKNRLFRSSWIKLFPFLKHMLTAIDVSNLKAMTNAKLTKLTFEPEERHEVGGIFKGDITAYGDDGKRKTYGGDFFIATLRRPNSTIDGVSCEVTDNMDGSYAVACILPWEGKAEINVIMLHPSESIFQMMKKYSSDKEFGVYMNTTMLNSKKHKEYSECSIGFPDHSSQTLCDFSNPSHGERRMCVKPPSGECSKILWQERKDRPELRFWDNVFFRKEINYKVPISESGTVFYVGTSNNSLEHFKQYRSFNTNPASPRGWFFDSKWTSLRVNYSEYLSSRLEYCAKNKRFYFFGDSTIRQWYSFFKNILHLKDHGPDNSVAWSQGRDAQSGSLNLTLQYRAHGPPLHNPGPEESRPYISDSLDLINKGGNGTIVFITVGFHFDLFDPDVFGTRIRIIKDSVISLLKRLPGAKVFIKGLHTHAYSSLCPSAWLNFRYDVMLRHEFRDVKDVVFLEIWDLTVLARNDNLHPHESILHHIMGLVISCFC